ncbi:MAG: hypothetical protein ACO1OB_06895 [Archangium sp.]
MPKFAQTSQLSPLYRKYGATIYSRCRRLVGDERRAAEAAVEAFTIAFPELINSKREADAVAAIYRACDEACGARESLLKCG